MSKVVRTFFGDIQTRKIKGADFHAMFYYPCDTNILYKLISYFFNDLLLFTKNFYNVSMEDVREIVREFNFTILLKDEDFEKDKKDYIVNSCVFVNDEQKVAFELKLKEDEYVPMNLDSFLNGGDKKQRETHQIGNLTLYYVGGNNNCGWFEKLLDSIKILASKDHKRNVQKNTVNFLCHDGHAFKLKNVKTPRRVSGDLSLNYGDSFLKVHNHLIKFLDSEDTGLAILHGIYGCLSGDTLINIKAINPDGSKSFDHINTIKHYYHKINNLNLDGKGNFRNWDNSREYFISCHGGGNRITRSKIKNIVFSGVKPTYLVRTITGKEIVSTLDHKFLTHDGYKQLADIKIGDLVGVKTSINSGNRFLKRKRSYSEVNVKFHPSLKRTRLIGKKYLFYRVYKHHFIYEANMNGLSEKEYRKYLNSGINKDTCSTKFIDTEKYEIHHKDGNWRNNEISNLQLLTKDEHKLIHSKDNDCRGPSCVTYEPLDFIKFYKNQETYDIECDGPHHNFVANEFIVHNSGKTFYIRHLLSVLNKKVIYIPPNLVGRISEPDFLSFLLNQTDFILVIEDAEEVITTRKDSNNPAAVANLLNLSDGILGDCLKVKILVTFNCKVGEIDPALLRKGRLKLEHEFGKLSIEQANKLFKHLGINHETKEPMSVGDIYSFEEENFRKEKEKAAIGFGR